MGMYWGEAAKALVMTTDAWVTVSAVSGSTVNCLHGSLSTRNADVAEDVDGGEDDARAVCVATRRGCAAVRGGRWLDAILLAVGGLAMLLACRIVV